ncbi:MAG TPA: UvrD-helicase domain-containing protein [Acidimicrobiales bacterium]|nr:UvrD-helicase domain-containing protein [Acidimicrobiales bacterium]
MTASVNPEPPTAAERELAAEQAVVDHAYARLEAMRESARRVAAGVLEQGAGGTHQARLERDVRLHVSERRLAELKVGDAPLCFGRTDHTDGQRLYIGRLAVSDEGNDSLVVDWRAPAAEPFYRATGRHPMGLVRRRHLIMRGRRVVGIDDELLAEPPEGADGDALVLVGEGALVAALDRSRTGRMGDIVATIQAEQDEIIRSPLAGLLVVQGGPGSGKTAVALHRAAYLLYTHRFPLERAGVLLVGPNRIFLRYIEDVLPSLGEHTVTFATPAGLRPGTTVRGSDGPAALRVKGDARMVELLARAVTAFERPLDEPVSVPWGRHVLTVPVEASRRFVGRTRRRSGAHNERRAGLERLLVRHLLDQLAGRGVLLEHGARAEAEEGLREEPAFTAACDAMWPVLTPEALLHALLGSPELLAAAGDGLLSPDEREALYRKRGTGLAAVAWTAGDVPVLDELAVLLGRPPVTRPVTAVRDGNGQRALQDPFDDEDEEVPDLATRTFGHVVVDEAQDLSPMQWRMLARRCPAGSMTIVGDLGQATGPWAPRTWNEVLARLPGRRDPRVADLTVNNRTPAEVMHLAARLLAAVAPDMTPPVPVRHAGVDPIFEAVEPDRLMAAAAGAARAEAAEVGPGKVAVIAPTGLAAALAAAIGPDLARAGNDAAVLDAPVAVLTLDSAKGLEFDSVVVVEPARVAAESPQGLRALYVALTRTTRRLRIVHAAPLPDVLAA